MLKKLFLLFLSLFSLSAVASELLLPPVLIIEKGNHEIEIAPSGTPGSLKYEMIAYSVKFQNTTFNIGINKIELKGIEDAKQMILGEIQMSIDTKVIKDYFYKDFLILRLQATFFNGEAQELRIFEIALNYSQEKFLIAFSRDVQSEEESSESLHVLIDQSKVIRIAEMDQRLGYPMSEKSYNTQYEELSKKSDYAQIFALQTKYSEKFSLVSYFNLIDQYESSNYKLFDVLDLYFNYKQAQSPLAKLFRLQVVQPSPFLIDFSFPLLREKFIEIINQEVLPDSLFAYDYAFLSENDRTFEVTYSKAGEEDYKTMIIGFDYTANGWQQQRVELPPSIAAVDPSGQTWQFTLLDPAFTTIYAKKENAYYFKPKYASQEAWMKIPILPADTSQFLFIEIGFKINTDYLSTESTETKIMQSLLSKKESHKIVAEKLKANALTIECTNPSADLVAIGDGLCAEKFKWKNYVRLYASPSERAYCSPLMKEDIDKDGIPEFFNFTVSNGKVIAFHGLQTKQGKVIPLKKEQALPLLKDHRELNNMIYYSQIR